MNRLFLLSNDYTNVENTYKLTEEYLLNHKSVVEKIECLQSSYHLILEIIPETLQKLGSGHTFPYFESYHEFENSLLLGLQGFYRHSFYGLRSMIELGVLTIFYDREGNAGKEIRDWLMSNEETPWFKEMLKRIFNIIQFKEYNKIFALKNELQSLYSEISDWVHVRGLKFSSRELNMSNVNNFIQKSFELYVNLLERSIIALTQLFLLHFPLGCQGVPYAVADEIAGGFVTDHQSNLIQCIISKERREKLKELSDNNEFVIGTLKWVEENYEQIRKINSEYLEGSDVVN